MPITRSYHQTSKIRSVWDKKNRDSESWTCRVLELTEERTFLLKVKINFLVKIVRR